MTEHFDDTETVQLLTAICAINAWNRLAIRPIRRCPNVLDESPADVHPA